MSNAAPARAITPSVKESPATPVSGVVVVPPELLSVVLSMVLSVVLSVVLLSEDVSVSELVSLSELVSVSEEVSASDDVSESLELLSVSFPANRGRAVK